MGLNFNAGTQMFYTRPSDGATYCFSPVPLIAESKEYLRTADGEQRFGVIHELTFTGTLLATIPALSGVDPNASCLEILDRKSDQLCSALSEDRGNLLIVDASGYPVVSVNPLVQSLTFDESQMVQQRQYTLTFSYEEGTGASGLVREFDESWSYNQEIDDTISVSHNISVVGLPNPIAETTAIENAKLFAISKLSQNGIPDKTQSAALRIPIVDPLVDIDSLGAFNRVLTENVGTTDGSYELNETWTLSSGAFQDDRTIEQTFELDETNNLVKSITINGTVQGLGDTTFDKFSNAVDGFNSFVTPQIGFDSVSGVQSKNRSDNRVAGTVTYSITLVPSGIEDQLQTRSISRQIERQDDGSVIQTVTTSAQVRPGSASGIQLAIDFSFTNNTPVDSTEPIFDSSFSTNIASVSTTRDDISKTFSLTRVYHDQSTPKHREEVSVERQENLDTSVVTISVQGTVFGLGTESSTKSEDRFVSASGAYFGPGGIESKIIDRAAEIIPVGTCISEDAITKTLAISKFAGTISYSQSFDSRFKTTNASVLKEGIEINFVRQGDVIAEIPIPGKKDGPILQDQETKTGLEKSLNISYTMKRSSDLCENDVTPNNVLLSTAITESDILVDNTPTTNDRGEKPESSKVFKVADTIGWNRQSLVFTRNVTWRYLPI